MFPIANRILLFLSLVSSTRNLQQLLTVEGYIFSGAKTPIRVNALCITICMACVSVIRASLSPSDFALMTGSAL